MPSDIEFMRLAIEQAERAGREREVPVGAVLVRGEEVIAAGANRPIGAHDPTAHAEIEALRAGGRELGSYRLTDTTLYVTLEPCAMCAGAIIQARIARLVYGAADPKAGAIRSVLHLAALPALNHRFEVTGEVNAEASGALLSGFFVARRSRPARES